MSLELCVLASGSSGNASVVRAPGGVMLIDAGIGPRSVAKRMAGTGVKLTDVRTMCLTHLDSDHFTPAWVATVVRLGIRVRCHVDRVEYLLGRVAEVDTELCAAFEGMVEPFGDEAFEAMEGVKLWPLALAHDEVGSHGFLIECGEHRAGYATDLGRVPERLYELFRGVDVLAIESNYDPHLQRMSGRPQYLQKRIMGGRGHLSNEQAFEAVKRIFDECAARAERVPGHVVLLHRSRQCNAASIVREVFERDPRIAARLTLAEQGERSEWFRRREVGPAQGEQLTMGWR